MTTAQEAPENLGPGLTGMQGADPPSKEHTMTTTVLAETSPSLAPSASPTPVTITVGYGPVTPDFDGRGRGWKSRLILDPEEREVRLYTEIGSATPRALHLGTEVSFGCDESAASESLQELLEAKDAQALLAQVCDCYLGEHWDGQNSVGQWDKDEDGTLLHVALLEQLEELIRQAEQYTGAGDWIGDTRSECRAEVRKTILAAASAEAEVKALVELADEWIGVARSDGTLLDRADVVEEISELAQEVSDEGEQDTFWVVRPDGSAQPLETVDVEALAADVRHLGETWWVVDATSPVKAWRAVRPLRARGVVAGGEELRAAARALDETIIEHCKNSRMPVRCRECGTLATRGGADLSYCDNCDPGGFTGDLSYAAPLRALRTLLEGKS